MTPFTVYVDGDDHGHFVFGLSGESLLLADPEDGRLDLVPVRKCRVASRFMSAEQALWWQGLGAPPHEHDQGGNR